MVARFGQLFAVAAVIVAACALILVLLMLLEEDSVVYDCGSARISVEGDEAGEVGLREADLRRLCVESLEARKLVP